MPLTIRVWFIALPVIAWHVSCRVLLGLTYSISCWVIEFICNPYLYVIWPLGLTSKQKQQSVMRQWDQTMDNLWHIHVQLLISYVSCHGEHHMSFSPRLQLRLVTNSNWFYNNTSHKKLRERCQHNILSDMFLWAKSMLCLFYITASFLSDVLPLYMLEWSIIHQDTNNVEHIQERWALHVLLVNTVDVSHCALRWFSSFTLYMYLSIELRDSTCTCRYNLVTYLLL